MEYCLSVSFTTTKKKESKTKIDAHFIGFQDSIEHLSRKLNSRSIFYNIQHIFNFIVFNILFNNNIR